MKRNPIEKLKQNYYDSIKFKTIRPKFFFTQCCNCGNEFKNETMYKCAYPDSYFDIYHKATGCTECFPSIDDFKTFCKDEFLVPETDWFHNGKPCTPCEKRFTMLYEAAINSEQ